MKEFFQLALGVSIKTVYVSVRTDTCKVAGSSVFQVSHYSLNSYNFLKCTVSADVDVEEVRIKVDLRENRFFSIPRLVLYGRLPGPLLELQFNTLPTPHFDVQDRESYRFRCNNSL